MEKYKLWWKTFWGVACQDSTRPNGSNPLQDKLKPQELQSHLEHCHKVSRKYNSLLSQYRFLALRVINAFDCYQAVCKLWKMIHKLCSRIEVHTQEVKDCTPSWQCNIPVSDEHLKTATTVSMATSLLTCVKVLNSGFWMVKGKRTRGRVCFHVWCHGKQCNSLY